jgi:DNA-binding IclR family transcriptional regulator
LIRAQGHCISHGEINEQLSAVSVPILSEGGSLLGSMNAALPTFRASPEVLELHAKLLKRGAREIARALQ